MRILMAEDDKEFGSLNKRLLTRRGYDVDISFTAAEAKALFNAERYDLVILDVMLPDGNGYELCHEFRKYSDIPILFLTGKDKTEDKVKGLDIGGDYYLTKPFDYDEFLSVVKSLLRRQEREKEKQLEIRMIKRGILTLDIETNRAYVSGKDTNLTNKEFAILLTLIKNEGREISAEQLYKTVWSEAAFDTRTVRSHISNLRSKLEIYDTDVFDIISKHGKGYCFICYDEHKV